MRTRIGSCLLAFLWTIAARSAPAGTVRGSVSVGTPPDPSRAREAVIWFEQVPRSTERQLARTRMRWFWQSRSSPLPQIVEHDLRFQPRVLAVAAGSAVLLRNEDTVWHGVFSVSPQHAFDVGKRAPGAVDTLRFDSTGVVTLRCDIHPDMSTIVVVTPNHAFTRPDSSGQWRLPGLPPGRYVVHAWHPDGSDLRRPVRVPFWGTVRVALRW